MLQQSEVKKFPKAPHRDIRSIRNWHYNHSCMAISADEQKYLEQDDDLFCLVRKDKTPLRRMIDSSHRLRTMSLWRHKSDDVPTYDAGSVFLYSDQRIDGLASAIIIAIGITMLITPIWVLQAMDSPAKKLVVITMFVLAFLLTLSFAMVAKPFEALGATAA